MVSPCADGAIGAPEHARSRGVRAQLRVCRPAAGPEGGPRGPAERPPGQPAVLGLVLGAAAGDALPEDRRHGARLLGHDGVPQVVGQQQAHGSVLGPGSRLLGPLPGLRDGQEPRPRQEAHHRSTLPNY